MSFDPQQELTKSAFGEVSVTSNFVITQVNAIYSQFRGTLTFIDESSSGSTSIGDSKFILQTGTAADGLASVLTSRHLSHRSGQGSLARFSALFDVPVADNRQAAGLINAENAFAFGSFNAEFGIIYSHGGVVEAQELTITTPASGAENATITLDDVPLTVPLTGATVEVNAYEIAESLNAQSMTHRSTSNGATVYVINVLSEPKGVYSFSSATAVAAFVQKAAGLAPTIEFTPQSAWNQDVKADLITSNLNNYQIQFNGVIEFSIQDSETGDMVLVHRINHTNTSTLPSVGNPTFRVGWLVQNKGNTTDTKVEGHFAAVFVEGLPGSDNPPRAITASVAAVGTTATSIAIIRNRTHFGDKINRVLTIMKFVSFATQANKPAFFELIINPVFGTPVDFEYLDKENSIIEVSLDNVTVTGGLIVGALTVESGNSVVLEVQPSVVTSIEANTVFCIASRVSSGAAGDMQATMTVQEDF